MIENKAIIVDKATKNIDDIIIVTDDLILPKGKILIPQSKWDEYERPIKRGIILQRKNRNDGYGKNVVQYVRDFARRITGKG
jgi:hypothetical protein